ncbi:hypothetical protein ACFWBH_01325 [Streptomyces sp. NPDC059999]|uniref:hypothetical protein n=1 Tax=Streptomyces sp. NPDC059999 TaxID=3347030 RepID=UPI0036750098
MERITGWLADPALGEDRRFEVSRAPSPRTVAELRKFLHEVDLSAAGYQDAVVVYITGHGLLRNVPRHFLTLPQTQPDRLLSTAFPTSEIITSILDSESEHVLVLVDSCFSGALRAELHGLLPALSEERYSHHGSAVVTAGNHFDRPLVGSFTKRVALACDRMKDEAAGYTASHLSFAEWEQLLHQVGVDEQGREKDLVSAEWITPHSRRQRLSACLPNPLYQPVDSAATAPALRQLALTAGSLDEFWLERASGRTAADDPGWYFSGRAEPMARMTDFLRDGSGVLIVTGAAGSGKSALLARLVTLADPTFVQDPLFAEMVGVIPAELRPDPGSIDVAVLARNKSARVVVEDLLAAFGGGGEASTGLALQNLLDVLTERGGAGTDSVRAVNVVIDALDEAQDPPAVLNDVILPLARLAGTASGRAVRLILGVRSSPESLDGGHADLRDERADQLLRQLVRALGTEGVSPDTLRTDGPDCVNDIAAYVSTLLLAPEAGPYRNAPDAAGAAADVIAEAVAPSFLDARIAADQLRTAVDPQDLTEEGWLHRLADGTTGLLREDVKAVSTMSGVSADLLVMALRATALAPGAGLPWAEVWPAVTVALAAHEYGDGHVNADSADHAIRTLRSSRLTGYLATTEEDARTVYRPVHQRLTDLLLADHDWLLAPASATSSDWWRPASAPHELTAAHAAVTRALADLVERARPHLAHPYIRRHFLQHAATGQVLTDRDVPLELIAQETSGTLRARLALPLPTADPERRNLTAGALIEPYVDDSVSPTSRLTSIVFHRRVRTKADPASDLPDGLPMVPLWGRWAARVNVLAPVSGETNAVCAVPTLDGRALIAVASAAGGVRIWDATTGRHTADLDTDRTVVTLRAIRATGGRTFLVTADRNGVEIHDPVSGQRIASSGMLPTVRDAHVLEDGATLWKLIIVTDDGAFVWRPRAGGPVAAKGFPPSNPRRRAPETAVVRRASGHSLVAVSGDEGIRIWDPATDRTTWRAFDVPRASGLVTLARPGQDDLLVTGEDSVRPQRFHVWDPFTGSGVARTPDTGLGTVALPGEMAFAYTRGNRIHVRDMVQGTHQSFDADVPHVDALTVLEDATGVRIVSAGPQGVRLWELGSDGPLYEDGLAETMYRAPTIWQTRDAWPMCRLPYSDTGTALVIGTLEGLDVHDADTGRLLKQLQVGSVGQVLALTSPPGTALVAVAAARLLSIWDLVSETPVVEFEAGPESPLSWSIGCTPEGMPQFVTFLGDQLASVTLNPRTGEATPRAVPYERFSELPMQIMAQLPPTPAGETVVAARHTDRLLLIDMASGSRTGSLELRPRRSLRALCTLAGADGPLVAAATRVSIHLWNADTWSPISTWESADTHVMTGLTLPGGRTLLVTGSAGGVHIWEPGTGELLHALLTGAPVHALVADVGPAGVVLHLYGPAGLTTLSVDPALL